MTPYNQYKVSPLPRPPKKLYTGIIEKNIITTIFFLNGIFFWIEKNIKPKKRYIHHSIAKVQKGLAEPKLVTKFIFGKSCSMKRLPKNVFILTPALVDNS